MQEQRYGGADVARCQDVGWIENGQVERYQKQRQSIQTGWGRFDLAPPQDTTHRQDQIRDASAFPYLFQVLNPRNVFVVVA